MPMLYDACFPPTPRGSPAGEMMARWREKTTLDALEALTVYLGELREERKGVLLLTDGWRLFTPDARLLRGQPGETPGLPLPIGGRGRDDNPIIVTERGAREVTRTDQSFCEVERAALAQLDHRRRLQDIVNRANRSNVSFYPASPAGLSMSSTPSSGGVRMQPFDMPTPLDRQSALRMLAEATDGYAIVNTNNLSGGLARMISDSSAYYLLGYESTNSVLDGRYRRITVQVSRPGVQVRARPGYVAAPVSARTIGAPPGTRPDPMAAALRRVADAAEARTPLRLRDAAWSAPASDGSASGGFWIVGEIDPATRRDAAWTRGGTAHVVVQSADGRDLLTTTLELTALRSAFAVRVPDAGELAAGEYTVRVRMEGSDPLSRISETVRIAVPVETMGLGEAVLWRRGPATGTQPVPTADPRFRRNERLRLELPAASVQTVMARLLDRNGALLPVPVTVSGRPDDSGAFHWVILDVVLAPLAPGDYVVEASQGESSRVTAFRIVP
jgi:VWFA-related protein